MIWPWVQRVYAIGQNGGKYGKGRIEGAKEVKDTTRKPIESTNLGS